MHSNLSKLLRQANLLSETQESEVVFHAKQSNCSIVETLLTLEHFDSQQLAISLSEVVGLPIADLSQYNYVELCQQLGLRELITRFLALPISTDEFTLTLAITDPTHGQLEDEFRFATGLQVEYVLVDYHTLHAAIRRLYGHSISQQSSAGKEISQDELANIVEISDDENQSIEDLSQDDSPVSRFINQILMDAVRKGASDIHFEPYESSYRVRFRCDGILIENQQPAAHLSRRLSARLKILAKLDIAERRLPQDGRIKLRLDELTAIDIRVSTLPTMWGEKIVLRLLDSSAASLDIDRLGYSEEQKKLYLEALKKPQGMILMTGPTGSGKTVSLYSGLNVLNKSEVNISTAEDPVEINLTGINQVQVQPKIGFGFAEALRAFLRQDPDIVMVGEIRDLETASIAVKAAQTGHLVLSTLHTNSASETIVRLHNMGIENFNLVSSLSLIVAQRLARRLCSHCKHPHSLPDNVRDSYHIPSETVVYQANKDGCNQCNSGYSGRTGIYEMMTFNASLTNAILQGASVPEIEKIAVSNGMNTLAQSGIEKLREGITSFAELQRVLYL